MLRVSLPSRPVHAALAAAGLVCVLAQPPAARAWGNEGHRLINRLAASTLPADVPAFLRSEAAVNEIEYLGPEPDRWRSPAELELSAAQAPEHFAGLEEAGEVFRGLSRAQLQLGGRTPAIRLGTKVLDLVHRRLRAQESGHIGGQRAGRKPVDQAMALIAPCAGGRRLSEHTNQPGRRQGCVNWTGRQRHTQHGASIGWIRREGG